MKQLEFKDNEYVWRIYVNGVKSPAYIPFSDVRPNGVSDEQWEEAVELDNQLMF